MVAINQEQLLGEIIPDVRISKITLESGGSSLIEDNPHIEHEREISSRLDGDGDSDGLKVTLTLSLKEKLDNDLIGTWLGNQEIEKYLKIRVIQVTDPRITEMLSYGSDAIDLLQPEVSVSSEDIRTKLMAVSLNASTTDEMYRILAIKTKYREINVLKDIVQGTSALNQFSSRIDDDGNKVYDITYNMEFQLPISNPKHLAYFAVSSFDIVGVSQDYGLDLDTIDLKETNGKVTSEIVIEDYGIVSHSFVFYDKEGKIWAGPVHQLGQQWRSGVRENGNNINLERFVVVNSKIQDFRDVKEIERLVIDFSNLQNNLLSKNLTKLAEGYRPSVSRNTPFFSDMFIARDKDGDSKFFFTVDFEKIMEDNAVFGDLIKNMPRYSRFRDEILKRSHIRSMRIFRRRVEPRYTITRLQSPGGLEKFDENEPDELIVNSSEKRWRRFVTINNRNASLREVDIYAGEKQEGIRHFTGMDKTMSDVTDGVYQYGVEIEIDDATVSFLEEKVQELMDAKAVLQQYYNVGSQLSMSKYLQEVRSPHIDHPGEFAGTSGRTSGNYDPISNRFTQHFIDKMRAKYNGRNIINAPWISAVGTYVNVLDIFTGAFSATDKRTKLLNSLYSYTSPNTGNPNGILTVMRVIDSLITTLLGIIGVTTVSSPRKWDGTNLSRLQSPIVSLGRSPKKSFKVVKFFDQTFDSEVVKSSGIDYLSQGEDDTSNDDGVRVMFQRNMVRRADLETLRYFKNKLPSMDLTIKGKSFAKGDTVDNTKLSYFSPTRIDFMDRSTILTETNGLIAKSDQQPVKSKISRLVTNINDGTVTKEDNSLNLISTMLYKNSISQPGAVRINTTTSLSPSKVTALTTNKTLSNFLSQQMGSTTTPVRISLVDEGGAVKLRDTTIIRRKPEISLECALPDPKVEPPEDAQKEDNDSDALTDFTGINGFLGTIMKPPMENGSSNSKLNDVKTRNNNFLGTEITKAAVSTNSDSDSKVATDFTTRGDISITNTTVSSITATSTTTNNKVTSIATISTKTLGISAMRNSPEIRSIQGLAKPVPEAEYKMLPNQIKAVLLKDSSGTPVRPDKIQTIAEANNTAISNGKKAAELVLDYGMIMKVEFLAGFKISEEGETLVREPIWNLLTPQANNLVIGKQLLCRLRGYENPAFGIVENRGLKAGVYDQYFLYVPEYEDVGIRRPAPPPVISSPNRFLDDFIKNMSDIFPGIVLTPTGIGGSGLDDDLRDRGDIDLSNVNISIGVKDPNTGGSLIRDLDLTRPGADELVGAFSGDEDEADNNGKSIKLPVEITGELIGVDCQTKNVETEVISTVVVPSEPIEAIAQEEVSVSLGAEDSITPEEDCPSPIDLVNEAGLNDNSTDTEITVTDKMTAIDGPGDLDITKINPGDLTPLTGGDSSTDSGGLSTGYVTKGDLNLIGVTSGDLVPASTGDISTSKLRAASSGGDITIKTKLSGDITLLGNDTSTSGDSTVLTTEKATELKTATEGPTGGSTQKLTNTTTFTKLK